MKLLASTSQATPPLLSFDLTILLRYERSIYLVTAICCLLFAFLILSLLHRAGIPQEKKWAQPFAITFLVLAAIYVLLMVQLSLYGYAKQFENSPGNLSIGIVLTCFSGLTNYLFLLSGSRLWEPELTDDQRLRPLRKFGVNSVRLRRAVILLLLSPVILAAAEPLVRLGEGLTGLTLSFVSRPALYEALGRLSTCAMYSDLFLSFGVLSFMGYALYKNSSLHREKLVAWMALLSALGYAVLYLMWFGSYLYLAWFGGDDRHFPAVSSPHVTGAPLSPEEQFKILVSVLVSLFSLPLKFGLFISATSRMLLLFGPLQEIFDLHENFSEKQGEYLGRGVGFVEAVGNALPGCWVGLFIKVPGSNTVEADGSKTYQIDLFDHPAPTNGGNQAAMRLDYDENKLYARVMKRGKAVTDKELKGPGWLGRPFQRPTRVGVPILFHNSVIACLAVEIGDRDFTATDRIKLERLATYISPAVQSYRELTALNRMTEKAAEHQLKLDVYQLDKDLRKIAEIFHDAVSPLSTGIAIRAGFTDEYQSVCPPSGPLSEPTRRQLEALPDKKVASDLREEHRWLKNGKGLTLSKVDSSGRKTGEQVFGQFIFAADKESQRREHPTLGTNITSFHAVSNLLTDILLDFVRGHLNQLTDRLGARVSGLGVNTVADWFKEVEVIAREAKLLWAVVRYPDGDGRLLGGEAAVRLVEELECPSRKELWARKGDGFCLYSLGEPKDETCHVIRRTLDDSSRVARDSSATLWLGVARPNFGEELDYVSPWKYFLNHFWKISDSALLRLLNQEEHKRRMGEVQSIIAGTLTVGTITHDLVSETRALVSIAEALPRNKEDSTRLASLLSDMRGSRDQIEGLLPKLSEIYKRDPRKSCSLHEAVERALDRVRYYLTKYQIRVENNVAPGAYIDIPFDAAANALAIVLDNAKDAIRDRLIKNGGEGGHIRISMRTTEDMFACDIADDGLGVPPELRDKLLKEVCKSRKKNSHGVGLLFSAYLLRLYNGDIKLTESGPQPNTTFSIYFPKLNPSLGEDNNEQESVGR
jgi:signal transduction histidine kinase